ncbi:MAG: SDR family oxidoreductase [Gemmatimonadota bacterium]|nr:SDR family oxidoreductase [Gemmatimonadota bacterium]|tara:strand:+ start:5522 stop:6241 length:720 start_codon:yes stop_codon:yes gene_type:complete
MVKGQSLVGRTALVTGASRGIGRSVSQLLASEGAVVWGLARSESELIDLAAETCGEVLVADVADDLATWEAIDRMKDTIKGVPDIVVNSAGVFGVESVSEATVQNFDERMGVNLRGTFIINRAVLSGMLERRSGTIINVGSVAGRKAYPGNSLYSASKFGLRGYHEVLLEEIRGTGVRATLIEPAATDTPLWDPLDPDSHPRLPNRAEMLRPEDVAQAVLFAVSRPALVRIPVLQIEQA